MSDEITSEKLTDYCTQADSKVLAAHVVVYRLLHIQQDLAKACMHELTLRANNGDQFDYEKYIAEKLDQMPKPMNAEHRSFFDKLLHSDLRKI